MKSKIIVFEGTDGVGKQTMSDMLLDYMISNNVNDGKVMKLDFPRYGEQSSDFAISYLKNELDGIENSMDLDPMIPSTLFAIDRVLTFNRADIKSKIDEGYIIILDRYVSSNILHQATKLVTNGNIEEVEGLIMAIETLEYNFLKLPEPDQTFYLYTDIEFQLECIKRRALNDDVHESDIDYMVNCSTQGATIAKMRNWDRIKCNDALGFRSREEILEDIIALLR